MIISVVERTPIGTEESSSSAWRRILCAKERYSFFQTPQWAALLADLLPNARPYHRRFQFSDGREALLPCLSLPKKWGLHKLESLPWGTYGDLIAAAPLTDDHRYAAIKSLLTLRHPICTVTVNPAEYTESVSEPLKGKFGWKVKTCATHILHLQPGFEAIWSQRFQPRLRTSIRRAEREGVTIRSGLSEENVEIIKSLYRTACEQWSGVETLPEDFFGRLTRLNQESAQIWIAEREDVPLAANVMFYGRGEAQYFAGASDKRYSSLQSPKFLMSEIIRDACARKITDFNFGASGGLPGVEQFKGLFGAEEAPYRQLHAAHLLFRGIL